MRKIRGFTLIELLIVIAILGILIALILPRFADVRKDANTKVCVANLRSICSAMTVYEEAQNVGTGWAWEDYTMADLVNWDYMAVETYCPYSMEAKTSYSIGGTAGQPGTATCPNVGAQTDHVWP